MPISIGKRTKNSCTGPNGQSVHFNPFMPNEFPALINWMNPFRKGRVVG